MAFPEGMRSPDGRLMNFKPGLFSMALKCGVPIVPITISHAHAVMPGKFAFPVQPGAGKLNLHVHAPIDTTGKEEADLVQLVREAFLSQLPFEQHPLEPLPPVLPGSKTDSLRLKKPVVETTTVGTAYRFLCSCTKAPAIFYCRDPKVDTMSLYVELCAICYTYR